MGLAENKILIVDDEEDIGLMVSKSLIKEGYPAEYVTRIETAKKKINENDYQLFLLDLNLPDGTGFDLIPLIKELNKEAKVIIISAFDGPEESRKIRENQVSDFIKKPFSKLQVINAVNHLIGDTI